MGGSGLLMNGLSLEGEFLSGEVGEVGEEREAGGGAGGFPRVPVGVGRARDGDPLLAHVSCAGRGGAVRAPLEGSAGGATFSLMEGAISLEGLPVDI